MYSPSQARFTSRDPLPEANEPMLLTDNNWFGDRLTMMRNLYGYGNNNPMRFVDPSGEVAIGPAVACVGCAACMGPGAAVCLWADDWLDCFSYYWSLLPNWHKALCSATCTVGCIGRTTITSNQTNVIKCTSQTFRGGIRIDYADPHKPYIHPHVWQWWRR
jgi:RHS repeat-associated protein